MKINITVSSKSFLFAKSILQGFLKKALEDSEYHLSKAGPIDSAVKSQIIREQKNLEDSINEIVVLKDKYLQDMSQLRMEVIYTRSTMASNSVGWGERGSEKFVDVVDSHLKGLFKEIISLWEMQSIDERLYTRMQQLFTNASSEMSRVMQRITELEGNDLAEQNRLYNPSQCE